MARLQRYSSIGELTRATFESLIPEGRSVNPKDRMLFRNLVVDAKAFAQSPDGWLLLWGPSGAGKTHLAAAIANDRIQRGEPALFVVVPDLLDELRSAYAPNAEIGYDASIEQLRNAPLLILDDLGTQNTTPWAQEKLFQILNYRYNSRLPTVVTTNVNVERLDERLGMRLTDPELSRVYHVEASSAPRNRDLPDALDLDRIREMTFEDFDTKLLHLPREQAWSVEQAYRSALNFSEEPKNWLVLWGAHGCGKTHLAAAIANRVRARGERPVFFMVPDLLDYLRQLMDRSSDISFLDGFKHLRDAPLLVLDDLGAQSDVAWVRDRMAQLINHRYAARLPTVFTATLDAVERLDERILWRLNDPLICTEVPILAPGYRVERSQPNVIEQATENRRRIQGAASQTGRPRERNSRQR